MNRYKAKPKIFIRTAIGSSSKIWKFDLHRNKAKLENFRFRYKIEKLNKFKQAILVSS